MATQLGAAAPPVQRRVETTEICFSHEAAPAGRFAVRVTCYTTRSFELWRRDDERPQDVIQQKHAAGGHPTIFAVHNLADLRTAAACRGTLSGMLAVLPQLRALHLTEDEWYAVVPEEVVQEIVATGCRVVGFTFCLTMNVHLRVIHDERALMMACKERLASMAPPTEKDCAICVDGLERESAVELPGCNHAFHRRCISNWFSTATTCPMCRADIWLSVLSEFIGVSFTGEPAQGTSTTAQPNIE